MLEKLKELKDKFLVITNQIADPAIIADQPRWQKLCKEHAELSPIIEKYDELLRAQKDIDDAIEMLKTESDEDMREMLKEELSDAKENVAKLEDKLKILLLPKDPNDDKNVIVEIRAGAGGDAVVIADGRELR